MPELASGAAPELDELRASCRTGVEALDRAGADVTYVVGGDSSPTARDLSPWGVDVGVDVPEPLPIALLVGAWLTRGRSRSFVVVADDLEPRECAELGRELAASTERVALLVMGDGSARHSEKAPGYLDNRAAAYDESVARALGNADCDALLDIDPQLSRDLLAAGRPAWQVLAGAARGRSWQAQATTTVPYGVAYHVATWL